MIATIAIPSMYGDAYWRGMGITSAYVSFEMFYSIPADTLRIATGVDFIHATNVRLEQFICIWFAACRLRMPYPCIRNPSLNRPNLFVFKIHEIS